MSAFVCTDLHINTIVTWGARLGASFYFNGKHTSFKGNEQHVAGLLHTANVESVNERYTEDEISEGFKFKPSGNTTQPVVNLLSLLDCFDYQSCEVRDYEKTIAHTIIQGVRRAAIRSLPGYDQAPWAI